MNIVDRSNLTEWVQALQPGDEVLASARRTYGTGQPAIEKVARVTPTQVVLENGARYDRARNPGRLLSSELRGEIRPVTQKTRDRLEQARLQNWLDGLARGAGRWDKLQPLHLLRAMKAAHDKSAAEHAEPEPDGE